MNQNIQEIINENIQNGTDESIQKLFKAEEQMLHRQLSGPERELIKERLDYLKEHKGHELAHSEMFFIIIGGLILSQLLILLWKKYHLRSFNIFTLLGLCVVPLVFKF